MTIYVKSGDNSKEIEIFCRQPASISDPTPVLEKAGTVVCHCEDMVDGSTVPALFHLEWQNVASDLADTTLSGSNVVI